MNLEWEREYEHDDIGEDLQGPDAIRELQSLMREQIAERQFAGIDPAAFSETAYQNAWDAIDQAADRRYEAFGHTHPDTSPEEDLALYQTQTPADIEKLDTLGKILDLREHINQYQSEMPVSKIPNAETAIMDSIKRQLDAGQTDIDLSQKYDTTDPAKALSRHEKALENLEGITTQLDEIPGYTVNPGQAIAVGLKQAEVLKKSEEQELRHSQRLSIGI